MVSQGSQKTPRLGDPDGKFPNKRGNPEIQEPNKIAVNLGEVFREVVRARGD
jgi:hypothetical protein